MLILKTVTIGFLCLLLSACGAHIESTREISSAAEAEEIITHLEHNTTDTADTGADAADSGFETDALLAEAAEILSELDLSGLDFYLDAAEVYEQELLGDIDFREAFRAGLVSILVDNEDIESPLSLIADIVSDPAQVESALISELKHSGALWLVPNRMRQRSDEWYPPENGEQVSDNWVFHIRISGLSDHLFWAIVPRTGQSPYNYGFN